MAIVLLVIVLALVAGAGVALSRRPRKELIDPFTLQDPWRTMVHRAQSTATRFEDAVHKTKPGPLRERLTDVGQRVTAAVDEAWGIAKRGHALDNAVDQLKIGDTRRRLTELEKGGDPAVTESVRSQLASAERMASVAADARTRLQRLNAELDEAVARAIELSVSAADAGAGALQPLGADLDNVVGELESLRLALEETSGAA